MPLRPAPRAAAKADLRYLRREGNRKVRARRRRRTAVRFGLLSAGMAAGAVAALLAAGATVRWTMGTGRFPLKTVMVRGLHEATVEEVRERVAGWMGRNILTLPLAELEQEVRRHPWVGAGGWVRIDRRLPSSVVITVKERTAGGLALLDGEVWLLDDRGLPIDRYGPRYARYDFPHIKGIDSLRARGDDERLRAALADGVRVSRALADRAPSFWQEISEIDMSRPHEAVLRLEAQDHDLRLSTEDPLLNLNGYIALRGDIGGDDEESAIDYVDLRWRDRIAVMPAARDGIRDGGK
jgi:cell division septal protein FtsQ